MNEEYDLISPGFKMLILETLNMAANSLAIRCDLFVLFGLPAIQVLSCCYQNFANPYGFPA